MGIVAGFLVQNALKYLLKFGTVSNYLGYNALVDFFPKMSLKPNESCEDSFCVKRQKEFQISEAYRLANFVSTEEEKVEEILHEDNDFQIELCSEGEDMPDLNKSDKSKSSGLKYEYLAPNPTTTPTDVSTSNESSEIPLADLMAKLKSI
jgi:ubiquitin-like modifier-activating enzyme 5